MGRDRYSTRPVIENTLKICIEDLRRWDLLVPGESRLLQWDLKGEGGCSGTLLFTVTLEFPDLFCPENFLKIILMSGKGSRMLGLYSLEPVPCFFGGYRYFFWCGPCRKRVTDLYLVGKRLACRHCGGLVYQQCREHRSFLALFHRVDALRRKARRLKATGHPRKGNRYFELAEKMEKRGTEQIAVFLSGNKRR